jgi:hypothetical protein
MACRGVFFALTEAQAYKLLAAANVASDEQVMDTVEELEESWDQENLLEIDKAWEAIHRCLSDGTTDFNGGSYPLNVCILGGAQLYAGDDYIVNYARPLAVKEAATTLTHLSKSWFEGKYWQLSEDYEKDGEDLEYSWDFFSQMVKFFQRAAREDKSVVFTVDQ